MNVQVSLFGIIVLIIILNTIIDHLFNWFLREFESEIFFGILYIFKMIGLLLIFNYYINLS